MMVSSAVLVLLFGLWLIGISLFMLVRPQYALNILKRMGSSAPIHFGELIPRFVFGLGIFGISATQAWPMIWKICGAFLSLSAAALMLAPRRLHHAYARYWSAWLKPAHVRLCAPISLILGIYLVYVAIDFLLFSFRGLPVEHPLAAYR